MLFLALKKVQMVRSFKGSNYSSSDSCHPIKRFPQQNFWFPPPHNTQLSSRLVTLKRQCCANAQYSRRECLDIVGIPREVSGEVLEETVLNIFDKIGCSISPDHIESCHRISKKSDTVIVKFSRRKDCQQV